MVKYLDGTGLAYFWGKIKSIFAPKASPAFTGTPTAPTAAAGTNTTQLATTAFVKAAIDNNLELSNSYEPSSDTNEDLSLESGDSYEEAFSKLEKAILDDEETIATSLNDLNTRKIEIDDVPTKTSQLINDSGFLTSHQLLKTINNESLIGSGNITIQGGSGGDVNVIETVKVNGTALTPDANKAVDITVPAAVTESTVSGWGFTKNTGTYSKPSGGIPKSDLADSVQTSLGKADTALQSFTESDPTVPSHVKLITTTDISNWNGKQAAIADLSDIRSGAALGATALLSYTETDPTVPSWAKATNKPTYTAAEVGALPDTYTPPVISVNGQTGAVTTATVVKYVQETGSDYWEYSSENTLTAAEAYNRLISDPYNCYLHLKRYYEIGEGLEDSEEYLMYFQSMVYFDSTGFFEAYFVSDYNESYGNIGYATLEGNSQSYNISSFAKKTIPTVNNSTVTVTMNGGTVGTFTLNKSTNTSINLGTVLTSHLSLKTINGNSIVGTGDLPVSGLPSVTTSDNNKMLRVLDGTWSLITPITIYNGSTTPSSSLGNNGDIYIQIS